MHAMEFTLNQPPFGHAGPSTSPARAASSQRLEPLRHVDAGALDIAYYEAGAADGPVVMLLHGFPYDIHAYVDVATLLAVPAVTLDGAADGIFPASDGTTFAAKFTGRRSHHVIPRAGHNLPQEDPEVFANAVMELIGA
jgi:pimeloyl-ACP methyl ester carboxylesterase